MNNVTRRAHVINALIMESGEELHLTGKVTISNQVIGPDKWWVLSDNPESETVKLNPVGHLHSTYTDVTGEEVDLNLSELSGVMNPLWDELERLSDDKPTLVKDFESGQQKQWHLAADKFVRYNSTKTFIIRPMLYQNAKDDEVSQKLLIAIHALFVPPTTKKRRW